MEILENMVTKKRREICEENRWEYVQGSFKYLPIRDPLHTCLVLLVYQCMWNVSQGLRGVILKEIHAHLMSGPINAV